MPIPAQRDPEHTRRVLADWLVGPLQADAPVEVSEISGPAATGFSNETLIFDAQWRQRRVARQGSFVVRVAPTGYHLFLDPDLSQQYRVLETLGTRTSVPVPPVRRFEPDPSVLGAPFFLMDKVDGRVPADSPPYHAEGWVTELSPDERGQLWWSGIEAIAAVHRVDWRSLGLGFLDDPRRGRLGIEQGISYYRDYLAWVEESEPVPVAREALDWADAHLPTDEPVVLSWGDSRIGNVLFDEALRPAAVLDWEMVGLGAPAQDLAWTLFLDRYHTEGIGVPRLDGFPSREETVARYEQLSGLPIEHLEFYELYAGLRFTVIMGRLACIFKEWGLLAQDDPMAQQNPVSELTARLLDVAASA